MTTALAAGKSFGTALASPWSMRDGQHCQRELIDAGILKATSPGAS
jgi:hypothetical protein